MHLFALDFVTNIPHWSVNFNEHVVFDQLKLPDLKWHHGPNVHVKYFQRGCGGIVVECRTPNREVLGSIPTGVTVLCP